MGGWCGGVEGGEETRREEGVYGMVVALAEAIRNLKLACKLTTL
jgi:hypothetical protein